MCPLNLFCAAGRPGGNSHWCRTCGGYFVPELDRLVQCSGFPAARPHYSWIDGMKGKVSAMRRDHSEASCGWCLTSRLSVEQLVRREKRPPIVGYLIEEDTIRRPRR